MDRFHAMRKQSQNRMRQMTATFLRLAAFSLVATMLMPFGSVRAADGEITARGGGIISYQGAAEEAKVIPGTGDILLKFTGDGYYTLPGMTVARILAVGGGGGGGATYASGMSGNFGGGGGGGGGGMVETNAQYQAATYTVSVGDGGIGGVYATKSSQRQDVTVGGNGGDTVIACDGVAMITAYGGGGGGGETAGRNGGSGGGGSQYRRTASAVETQVGGSATSPDQGNSGGGGNYALYGGGGGGAGGAGADASTQNPVGGDGRQSDITGESVYFGGGGGGSYIDKTYTAAHDGIAGGLGGGGRGGYGTATLPTAGADGFGGGGGGCCADRNSGGGEDGGSGVVYVRIVGSIVGSLEKPESRTLPCEPGQTYKVVENDDNPFFVISGQNEVSAYGHHTVTVALIDGAEWSDGSRDPVTVTLTLSDPSTFSGIAEVTGAPIRFEGVSATNWIGGELILEFRSVGSFTLPGTSQTRILAVGGGGGGGATYASGFSGAYGGGGGGGAGGMVETSSQREAATYTVTVGSGGAGGIFATRTSQRRDVTVGGNGGNTVIACDGVPMITAYGGGGGGGETAGLSGGSGGGGSQYRRSSTQHEVQPGGTATSPDHGNAGGAGNASLYGGGGGGAGGAGADASTQNPVGGDGRQSDITGENVWYAGGGGGSYIDKLYTAAHEGIAGGQGGGGRGGYGTATLPTAGADGFGGGGGGCNADRESDGGAKGGSGIVIVRISTAMVGKFMKPKNPDPIVYDGNAHTSIFTTVFYDVTGDNVGTAAGSYVATATLKPGLSWPPPEGGDEPAEVTMTIVRCPVTFSGLHIDDWEFGTPPSERPQPVCTIEPVWVVPIYEYRAKGTEEWTSDQPSDVGEYELRVRAEDAVNLDFTIVQTEFSVTRIAATYSNFKQRNWMSGTPAEQTPNPTFAINPAWAKDYVVCEYAADDGGAPGTEWSRAKPTAVGSYWVRMLPLDADNFTLNPAPGENEFAPFKIVGGLGELFTDYVEIEIAGYTGTDPAELENFPCRIELSESDPVGFLYSRAGANGNDLTFTMADGRDILPYAVGSWDTNGTSVVYVRLARIGAEAQTIRLYWRVRDGQSSPEHHPEEVWSDWTQEAWEAFSPKPGSSWAGPVSRDGYFINYFVQTPTIVDSRGDPLLFWDVTSAEKGRIGRDARLAFDNGRLLRTFTNVVAKTGYEHMPTNIVGSFRVSYTIDDREAMYAPLECHIDYAVSGKDPWGDLRGNAKTLTLSGRVLLANDDPVDELHAVTDQSYWQTREVDRGDGTVMTNEVFWTHETDAAGSTLMPHILPYADHRLQHIGGDGKTNVLWRLENVRIGNHAGGNSALRGSNFYLPWSATGLGISAFEYYARQGELTEMGTLLMRNICDEADESKWSVVYSPCYTNGIGTIYFDAVNSEYRAGEPFRLVLEVATATHEGRIPTDENAYGQNENGTVTGLGKIWRENWRPVAMLPLLHSGSGGALAALPETDELSLDVRTGGGAADNFYRVCAKVNYYGPCRFRIRRVSHYRNQAADAGSFIVLDNLIVSYPNMTADVRPFGRFDEQLAGKQILGQAGALSVPFPAAGQTGIHARGMATCKANEFKPVEADSIILRSQFFYRWRYLDQAYGKNDGSTAVSDPGEWKSVDLWPADGLKSIEPLEIPAAEGDLEFWYRTFVNSPTYEYFDYTGRGIGLDGAGGKPLYVDEQLVVTNRIYRSEYDLALPSTGSDWFVRLRAGKSDYERIRLITLVKGSGEGASAIPDVVQTNDMEIVSDGVWRGCVQTLTALDQPLRYRLEGVNRQQPGAAEYAENVARWRAVGSVSSLPNSTDVEAAGENDWSEVVCDAKTGYLLFRLDEKKGSLYLARADYQDFNRWSSAVNEKFVGNVADTNTTTAVAQQINLDWSGFEPSVATKPRWKEDFGVQSGMVATNFYPRNEPFARARSLNGWEAENGMWTLGKYGVTTEGHRGEDSAVQLEGRGRGALTFAGARSAMPEGLDTVTYSARVAQYNDFELFAYFDGLSYVRNPPQSFSDIIPATRMSDVTFTVKALMTTGGLKSFSGNASLSLVANYDPGRGCYEFRVSLGQSATRLKLELYRWTASGGVWRCDLLGGSDELDVNSDWLIKDFQGGGAKLGGLFVSACATEKGVNVKGGVHLGELDVLNASAMVGNNRQYATVSYYDTASAAANLKRGTFGLLTSNCPGLFEQPVYYMTPAAKVTSTTRENTLAAVKSEPLGISGAYIATLASADGYQDWVLKPGRMERLAQTIQFAGAFGFQAIAGVSQAVALQVREYGSGDEWSGIATNEVTGFSDFVFTNVVRNTVCTDVRLQVLGSAGDPRLDVAINDVEMSQWTGQSTPDWDSAAFWSFPSNWVYTSAWVNEHVDGASTNRTVTLQPTRAPSAATPVALRSPILRGFGLLHLDWRNADPAARALVQIAASGSRNNLVQLTRAAPDDVLWETVETLDFGQLGTSGQKTVYLNRRFIPGKTTGNNQGPVRIVIDRAVTAAAIANARPRTAPAYGQVEITGAYVWDLPEYDHHSWKGWNFRTEGWDGSVPGKFANLADGGLTHGLSGLLNNTLDAATLADDSHRYEDNMPFVQTPTFGMNCIGAVDFRARLYGREDLAAGHPAVVSIYGAKQKNEFDEPVGWEHIGDHEISSLFYSQFTRRFKPSQQYFALRFAVQGVPGVQGAGTAKYDPPLRVALDDICVYERPLVALSFRKQHARPFRNAASIKGTERVRDIATVNEQPLIGESFGFQAEVETDSDEILLDDPAHPLTVDLWYYPAAEPWGFANWKDRPEAVCVRLDRALGEQLVFRSTLVKEASICPPQLLGTGEEYKVVQYQFVANYYDTALDPQGPYEMSAADWSMPAWNSGFADPNAKDGAQFSAFTVLETIAPKRAWINEISLAENGDDESKKDQWVEIAVPTGVDMTGWRLNLYDRTALLKSPVELLRFGSGGAPASKSSGGDLSHYDFYVVKSPQTELEGADATWPRVSRGSVSSGYLNYTEPYGLELVRPTGVVEHRVVVQGRNQAAEMGYYYSNQLFGVSLVTKLNDAQQLPHSEPEGWTWSGEDRYLVPGGTVSVIANQGALHAEWQAPSGRTPGAINENQYIDPDWFVRPNGGYCWINAYVQGAKMRQIVGIETNTFATLMMQAGATTSLVYEVDRWYQLKPPTVSAGTEHSVSAPVARDGKRYYTLTLSNVSNQTDVVAAAEPNDDLRAHGVTADNPYSAAILKWLEEGDFAGDSIVTGEWCGSDGSEREELDLTRLYWFGLDPTCGGWELWGGMGDKPGTGKPGLGPINTEIVRENPAFPGVFHTNVLTTCWMMIRNSLDPSYEPRPPAKLQGLSNEQSDTYGGVWTSQTFSVEMMLKVPDGSISSRWHSMRQFVFGPDSFRPADDPDSPFAARIEITDPFSRQSPAWEWGWWRYKDQGLRPWTRFSLSTDVTPVGVSVLKQNDVLEY